MTRKKKDEKSPKDESKAGNAREAYLLQASVMVQLGFPESYKQRVETICNLVKDVAEGGSPDHPDALSSEQQRFTVLSAALNDLIGLIPPIDELIGETASLAENQAEYLNRRYGESVEPPEELTDGDPCEHRTAHRMLPSTWTGCSQICKKSSRTHGSRLLTPKTPYSPPAATGV
jgi:hypothetical protein